MMTSGNLRRIFLLAVFLTMPACRSGCRGGDGQGASVVDPALALFPPEAQVFVSVDFARIRQTQLWQQLQDFAGEDPEDRRLVDDLKAKTGIDPFRQIHRIVAAFPEEARQSGAFGIIIEGENFDEKKILTYVAEEAKKRGNDVAMGARDRYVLWKGNTPDSPTGFFLDNRRFVLGAGGWAERIADRASGKVIAPAGKADGAAPTAMSPADTAALARLIGRVGKGRSIWMVARVPESTRAHLMTDPRFGSDASVMRFGFSMDLGPDLAGDLVAELASAADAKALASKATTFVAAAKKSPEVLLLGVAPYLDTVKAEAEGPTARIRFALPRAQSDELVGRLIGLLRLQRGAGRPPQ